DLVTSPIPTLPAFTPRLPTTPLLPYTTLFRSRCLHLVGDRGQEQTQGLQRVHRAHQDDGALSVLRGVAPYRRLAPVGGSYIGQRDRKSTRLNSSHVSISYAVFCLKKEI